MRGVGWFSWVRASGVHCDTMSDAWLWGAWRGHGEDSRPESYNSHDAASQTLTLRCLCHIFLSPLPLYHSLYQSLSLFLMHFQKDIKAHFFFTALTRIENNTNYQIGVGCFFLFLSSNYPPPPHRWLTLTTWIPEMLGRFLNLNKMNIQRLSNHIRQYFIHNRT